MVNTITMKPCKRAPGEDLWKIHKYGEIEQYAPKQLIRKWRNQKGNQKFKNALRQKKLIQYTKTNGM